MDGFWVAFGVIFVAELGDKSQLMALAFATRFPAWRVLIGITIATAITHAISVGDRRGGRQQHPDPRVNLVAGVAFLGFAGWTWRGDTLDEEDEEAAARRAGQRLARHRRHRRDVLPRRDGRQDHARHDHPRDPGRGPRSWLGSTIGMVAADALAIIVGRQLGSRLPERACASGPRSCSSSSVRCCCSRQPIA